MATLARFFLPPSKVQAVVDEAPPPRGGAAGGASKEAKAVSSVRLVRVYLPFSSSELPPGSPPPAGAPFVQLTCPAGDDAVSLYRLKRDVFLALSTALKVMEKQHQAGASMGMGGMRPSVAPFAGPSFGAPLSPTLSPPLSPRNESSEARSDNPDDARGFFSSLGHAASLHASRRTSSLDASAQGPQRARLGLTTGEAGRPPSPSKADMLPLPPKATTATTAAAGSAPAPPSGGAAEPIKAVEPAKMVSMAANNRRWPLPSRPKVRPRGFGAGGGGGELKSDDDDAGDEAVAVDKAEGEGVFVPSAKLAEAMHALKLGLADPSQAPSAPPSKPIVVPALSVGVTPKGSSAKVPALVVAAAVTATTATTAGAPGVASPAPFKVAASYLDWGSGGMGATVALDMLRRGPEAFAWRAVPTSGSWLGLGPAAQSLGPGAEMAVAEGWLWRLASSAKEGLGQAKKSQWKRRYYAIVSVDGGCVLAFFKDASKNKVLNAVGLERVKACRTLSAAEVRSHGAPAPPQGCESENDACFVVEMAGRTAAVKLAADDGDAAPTCDEEGLSAGPANFVHRAGSPAEARRWVTALHQGRALALGEMLPLARKAQPHATTQTCNDKFFENEMVSVSNVASAAPQATWVLRPQDSGAQDMPGQIPGDASAGDNVSYMAAFEFEDDEGDEEDDGNEEGGDDGNEEGGEDKEDGGVSWVRAISKDTSLKASAAANAARQLCQQRGARAGRAGSLAGDTTPARGRQGRSGACVSLSLELCFARLLPPPSLVATIISSKQLSDAHAKAYTGYELDVSQGKLRWSLWRRFSDFRALHASLIAAWGDTEKDPSGARASLLDPHSLPRLPQKILFSGSLKEDTVASRTQALGDYLDALCANPKAMGSVHVLSFLGLLSLNRDTTTANAPPGAVAKAEKKKQAANDAVAMVDAFGLGGSGHGSGHGSNDDDADKDKGSTAVPASSTSSSLPKPQLGEKGSAGGGGLAMVGQGVRSRPVMHVSRLRFFASAGDLILFRCVNSMSGLQRSVTGAEYDHVALVVPSAFATASLNLLESTAEGCTVYPLASRLKAYAQGFTQYMVLRRLEGCADPAALADRVRHFAFRVDGKPYGFSVGKLFQRKELTQVQAASVAADHSTSGAATTASTGAAAATGSGGGQPRGKNGRAPSPPPYSRSAPAVETTSPVVEVPLSDDNSSDKEGVKKMGASGRSRKGSLVPAPSLRTPSAKDKEGGDPRAVSTTGDRNSPASIAKAAKKRGSLVGWVGPTLTPKQFDMERKKTFFCSELVAAAQVEAGIIKPSYNVSYFWPGSFAAGGEVDDATAEGLRYGEEILIDTREVEVGRAHAY